MAGNLRGITIEIGGNTTKLGNAIKDSEKKSIDLASELKDVNKLLKFDTSNVDLLKNKQEILTAQVTSTTEKLETLKSVQSQIEAQAQSGDIGADQYREFQRELIVTEQRLESYSKALQDTTTKINQIESGTDEASSAFGQLKDTINQQEKELSQLKQAYSNVVLEQGKNSDKAKQLASEMTSLNDDLSKNKSEMASLENASSKLASALDDTGDGAKEAGDGFTVMKGAISDLLANGIQQLTGSLKDFVMEADTSYSKFQAQTGASAEEMKEFKAEIDDLYMNNFGESLQDVGDKMAYVKQVTGEVDPSKLKELTENTITLEDTFGSDFNETIRGVNNLMTHFGISSQEAFDLFAKGSQVGLDYTGELGDNIAEYGGNFQQAGYSAEEYFQLLENGSQNGAYNLDKVNDSIREVKNRLGDGTIEKNIDTFSQGTKMAFDNWQNGKGTMKDVINSIVGDIDRAESEQEALTMAQIAFGTMGEDANLKVVKSLTTVGDTFKNTKGTMEQMKEIRYDNVTSQLGEVGRTIQMDLVVPIAEKLLPIVKEIIDFVSQNLPVILPLVTALGTALAGIFVVNKVSKFIGSIKTLTTAFQGMSLITPIISGIKGAFSGLFSLIMAHPIIAIITAIIASIVLLWNNCESFRNAVTDIWNAIVQAFQSAVDWITPILQSLWTTIQSVWTSISTTISTVMTAIWNVITTIWNAIKTTIEVIITVIAVTIGTTWNVISTTISTVLNVIMSIVSTVWNAISGVISSVMGVISNVISTVWSAISNTVSIIVNAISNFISTVWNTIKSVTSTVWNAIKSAIEGPINTAKSVVTNVVNAVKSTVSNVWNAIKSTTSNVWNGIKSAIEGPMNKARDFVKGIIDTIKGFFNFKISWPHIPMPHFSINPKGWSVGDLLKGSIPSLGIQWYKKGAILNKATPFGTSPDGKLMVGGEAGAEAIAPISTLLDYVKQGVHEVMTTTQTDGLSLERQINSATRSAQMQADKVSKLVDLVGYYFPKLIEASKKSILLDGKELVGQTIDEIDSQLALKYQMRARGI